MEEPAGSLALRPRLGVQHAGELHQDLALRRGAALEVDASNVEAVTTLCVQVLVSAAKSWRADGQPLRIVDPSPAFLAALGHLHIDVGAIQSPEAPA